MTQVYNGDLKNNGLAVTSNSNTGKFNTSNVYKIGKILLVIRRETIAAVTVQ